ncbi:hypothetical protein Cgig2_000772 [Carnegiea gigantea]|uniref:Uncharacterized protein n=1 Tax=Carnegiea gigantea TaxID=171969 RepID=A0A9Q1QMA6_9CARY|nr:hypothetical protein Cgig2_000772 [Carnegiea gigantea]
MGNNGRDRKWEADEQRQKAVEEEKLPPTGKFIEERDRGKRQRGFSNASKKREVDLLFDLHVFEMELRSGWKRLQSLMTLEKLGRKSEESDPGYNNEEEGSAQSSPEAFTDNESLIEAWNLEMKCFKPGQRKVTFSYFDVALVIDLPTPRKRVAFERSEDTSEVEELLKEAMKECVSRERQRRRTVQRIYRNYVSISLELCKMNNKVETIGLFRLLYASWLLVSCYSLDVYGGGAWDLISMVENVGEDIERTLALMEAFNDIDEYITYMKDAQGVISIEECLRRPPSCLLLLLLHDPEEPPKKKKNRANQSPGGCSSSPSSMNIAAVSSSLSSPFIESSSPSSRQRLWKMEGPRGVKWRLQKSKSRALRKRRQFG